MRMTTGVMMPTVATTTSVEGTTIAAVTTTAEMTITTVMMITTGRMTIVGTIIATSDNRETTKGNTDRKMYARSDEAHLTTIGEGPAPQGRNYRVHRSTKNDNWYQ